MVPHLPSLEGVSVTLLTSHIKGAVPSRIGLQTNNAYVYAKIDFADLLPKHPGLVAHRLKKSA